MIRNDPDDIDDQIDELAVQIEQSIEETEQKLARLPEFAPRSQKSRKMRSALQNA